MGKPTGKQVGGDHYQKWKMQPIEFIELNYDIIGSHEANIIKYVCRYKEKNGIQDLEKARDYLNRLIKLRQNEETKL